MSTFKFMDINFRGMGTNYIFVDMYIWGSLTMAIHIHMVISIR